MHCLQSSENGGGVFSDVDRGESLPSAEVSEVAAGDVLEEDVVALTFWVVGYGVSVAGNDLRAPGEELEDLFLSHESGGERDGTGFDGHDRGGRFSGEFSPENGGVDRGGASSAQNLSSCPLHRFSSRYDDLLQIDR